jgi:hypothetical protein
VTQVMINGGLNQSSSFDDHGEVVFLTVSTITLYDRN